MTSWLPYSWFISLVCLLQIHSLEAQSSRNNRGTFGVKKVHGAGFTAKDSSFSMMFRFRIQTQAQAQTISGQNLNIASTQAQVRRLRLRFEGFLLDPRLTYYLQLSFSRPDMNIVDNGPPNVVRDAVVHYDLQKWWRMSFGQTKLPGNRQRVVSSGSLQFAERSLANNHFTLDRDFGWFNTFRIGHERPVIIKTTISSGEGRNASKSDNGLCYTARAEWIPFGQFAKDGDYSEGDVERTAVPSLSLGFGGSYNHKARRTGAQLGRFLQTPTDIQTLIADLLFKYQGWAVMGEVFYRTANSTIQVKQPGDTLYVYQGNGLNIQASRMLSASNELALRYVSVAPAAKLLPYEKQTDMIMLGFNRYLSAHRVKLQASVYYQFLEGNMRVNHPGNAWGAFFQMEVGI
ncbi:MAG: porin [Bacteroidia bacterium]|nr:porin [Bacteroidia bacterium]